MDAELSRCRGMFRRSASWYAALLLLLTATAAPAQTYPSPPVRIIVPVSPGGALDTMARAIVPVGDSPENFADFLRADREIAAKLVKIAGVRLD